jgi:hypothetical protein
MAPWNPIGLEESIVSSVDVGSALLMPTDDHRTLRTLAAIPLPARRFAAPDHGAVATYIITQLIGVPAWWHYFRWQLYHA